MIRSDTVLDWHNLVSHSCQIFNANSVWFCGFENREIIKRAYDGKITFAYYLFKKTNIDKNNRDQFFSALWYHQLLWSIYV